MKATLAEVRTVIREALEDAEVLARLQAIAARKKPYLIGQWVPFKMPSRGYDAGDVWVAEDPELGKVYLTCSSHTSYKKDGRLRDPSGTRNAFYAILAPHPGNTLPSYSNAKVFKQSSTGEGKEHAKALAFRKQVMKMFGVDPLPWKGPLEA